LEIEFNSEGSPFKPKIILSANGTAITKVITQQEGGGGLVDDTVILEKQ
jgi:hypothetical protein